MITVGSLFSGIGGIELGLERTGGFETIWQVEKDDFCREVLTKYWPNVKRFEDVREVGKGDGFKRLQPVDLICGGFPCQDISQAGPMEGIDGEQSGLWSEFARIIGDLRPHYVLVENVRALRFKRGGLGRILGDLAEIRYDAEWHLLPACAFGAPHQRERVFVLAYSDRIRCPAPIIRQEPVIRDEQWDPSISPRGWQDKQHRPRQPKEGRTPAGIRGVDDGLPNRVDRLRALGNAVVPQVAEFIGEQILRAHAGDQV